MALLKPGKDPSAAKSFRAISMLYHTYKLFERLILNRIAEHVDAKLIPAQAGYHLGKSCTIQLLDLTEHIEDGYEKSLITGAVLVDLSTAYDMVNHRSVTQVLPQYYDHLLRHKPTACEPYKDTGVCFPPKEPRSQTRTECSVERYQTLNHNNTSVSRRQP